MPVLRKFSTPLLVVAAALIAGDGRVLMQRRRLTSEHGGLWEFPGGKLEPGESPESALVREIDEELGIALDRDALVPLAFASGPVGEAAGRPALVILLYSCRDWAGAPACHDGEEIRWFALDALTGLAMPPLDYPLAKALISAFGENSR